jgi:uncharacterized repeat protein (TIGR01451 family)
VDGTPNLGTSTKADDDADNTVTPGQTVTFTLTLTNTGDSAATGVDVDDTLDGNFENASVVSLTSCGTYTDNSTPTAIDIDGVDVAVGTNCVIVITADVKSPLDEGTILDNTATVSAADEGGSGSTPSSDTLTVDGTPNLGTSTKADDDPDNTVTPGQTVTFTLTLVNSGDSGATGVDVDDTLDGNFENASVVSLTSCGSSYTDNSTSTAIDIDGVDVAVGTNCVIVFTADVKSPLAEGTTLDNTATVSAADEGGAGSTPSSDTLTVDGTPNLGTSTKADDDGDNTVTPGQTVTFTLTLINTGDSNATGVDVEDTLDTNLENLSVSSLVNCGTSYTDNSTATALDIDDVDVAVGTDCVIVFTADVRSPLSQGTTLDNTATISAADEGGVGSTPSSDTLTVDGTPNLGTSTKADDDPDNTVTPGQTVTYTLTLINTGMP